MTGEAELATIIREEEFIEMETNVALDSDTGIVAAEQDGVERFSSTLTSTLLLS